MKWLMGIIYTVPSPANNATTLMQREATLCCSTLSSLLLPHESKHPSSISHKDTLSPTAILMYGSTADTDELLVQTVSYLSEHFQKYLSQLLEKMKLCG